MELFLLILAFFSSAVFYLALGRAVEKKDPVKERIAFYTARQEFEQERERLDWEKSAKALLSQLSQVLGRFTSDGYLKRLQKDLIRAGLPLKGEEFLGIWAVLGGGTPVLLWLLFSNPGLAILGCLLGLILPRVYVNLLGEKRHHHLNQQLADALVVMANALRAGFGFQQAMETVASEMPPPIKVEFDWALREIRLGASIEEALLNLGERVKSEDLDMVITAVLIQRQVGGNLAQILDNISRTIRDRARIKGEIKTLTAQGRMSGLVIGLLPVGLFFILLSINPHYMAQMLEHPLGPYLLGGALMSELVGAWLVKKIVEIDY